MKAFLGIAILVAFGAMTPEVNHRTKKENEMKQHISIVEIPVADFPRAVKFYEGILNIKIEQVEMAGVTLGLFPGAENGIAVQLIKGAEYKPSRKGTMVYLNGGDDLQKILDKIKDSGGSIAVPKTEIGGDMGFYGMFMDSEGNKVGVYSLR